MKTLYRVVLEIALDTEEYLEPSGWDWPALLDLDDKKDGKFISMEIIEGRE